MLRCNRNTHYKTNSYSYSCYYILYNHQNKKYIQNIQSTPRNLNDKCRNNSLHNLYLPVIQRNQSNQHMMNNYLRNSRHNHYRIVLHNRYIRPSNLSNHCNWCRIHK